MTNFLLIGLFLFLTQDVLAQTSSNKAYQDGLREFFINDGYKLIEQGGMKVLSDQVLATDLRFYSSGVEYLFLGIVDDCAYCPVSIKFALPGQTPSELSALDADLTRNPKTENVTLIMKNIIFNDSGNGYFLLTNQTTGSRYMYAMLFEKK